MNWFRSRSRKVSHYRLGELIGSGSMGAVYRATDTHSNRLVAIKLLHEHLSDDPTFRERFRREAQYGSLLASPFTTRLLDYGEERGTHFLVMELVEGMTIQEMLAKGPLPASQALELARQVALSLDEAHTESLIHRDIKPENLRVTADGHVKVLDFGITRRLEGDTLTKTGSFVGTVAYAAPETFLAEREATDQRCDLYSLGATLFHMLAGERPFSGDTVSLIRQHQDSAPPLERLAHLPDEAIEVVRRSLEKSPKDRYPSAVEMAAGLAVAARAVAAAERTAEAEQKAVAADAGEETVAAGSAEETVAADAGEATVAAESAEETVAADSAEETVAADAGDETVALGGGVETVAAGATEETVASAAQGEVHAPLQPSLGGSDGATLPPRRVAGFLPVGGRPLLFAAALSGVVLVAVAVVVFVVFGTGGEGDGPRVVVPTAGTAATPRVTTPATPQRPTLPPTTEIPRGRLVAFDLPPEGEFLFATSEVAAGTLTVERNSGTCIQEGTGNPLQEGLVVPNTVAKVRDQFIIICIDAEEIKDLENPPCLEDPCPATLVQHMWLCRDTSDQIGFYVRGFEDELPPFLDPGNDAERNC